MYCHAIFDMFDYLFSIEIICWCFLLLYWFLAFLLSVWSWLFIRVSKYSCSWNSHIHMKYYHFHFSSGHVRMWKLDHKEHWALKNWCFQTAVLEKTLEGPLDSKEIKPINSEGNQPWIFIGRTDAEGYTLILWPSDLKSRLTGKDPGAGKDWGKRRGNRGWDGWMASPTQWTWVWANSGR